MAKYKLQELPDMQGESKRKVYPKMVINRTLNLEELMEKMKSLHRAFSPSTIEAVVRIPQILPIPSKAPRKSIWRKCQSLGMTSMCLIQE